ncbi:MAG: 30S ribosomal protein S8 [bacterium]|nr:30S ribosomal protein S8 [bacterium]
MTNYPIGDLLIRIKNAVMAKNDEAVAPNSKFNLNMAKALQKAGYLYDVSTKDGDIKMKLAQSHKLPVLVDIKLVSKPGRRIYANAKEIEKKKGPSIFIISTPKGILTSMEALKAGVGGEVVAEIW